MQEYASTSQTPLSKSSCHDSKSFFNFPPKNFTCKSMPQLQSLPSPRLLVLESKSSSKPPPKPYMQEYASTSQLHLSKTSCHDSKSFSKPPPQKPYMQEYSSTSQPPLSKTSCHDSKPFFKPPPPKPYMQEYASTSQLHLSKPSCHDSKSFFKPPPQNPTCKSIPQLHSLPYPRLLVTIPSHFLNLPPKPYMQEYASTSQPPLSKTSC